VGTEHQISFFLRESAAPDPARRAAAAKGLGRLGRPEHAQALVSAARDPEPVVRAAAALGLGRLGVPGTGDVLIGLMADADPRVRRRASVAADRLAVTGPAVTEAFERLLSDEDRHVRLNALVGLIRLNAPGDPWTLMRLLGDPEPIIWGHARKLVYARMGEDAVVAEVLRTARQGSVAARVKALEMLPARYTPQLRESLLSGLRAQAPELRMAVVPRLADDPEPGTAGVLLAALEHERDPDVARTLLNTLARSGDRRAQTMAVRWLDHPGVGPLAVRALARIGTPGAVRQIKSAVARSPHPYVRATAASVLGELGDQRTAGLLLLLIRDPDERVRAGALDGLRSLGDQRLSRSKRRAVTEALVDRLAADPGLTWHARNALTGYPEALPRVRGLVDHASGEVRAAALSLLEAADVDRFLAHLDDPHEAARYHATLGLGRYVQEHGALPPGGDGAVGLLTALTADDSRRTRQSAAEVLDALGR
jgi:HEAT repeat protein